MTSKKIETISSGGGREMVGEMVVNVLESIFNIFSGVRKVVGKLLDVVITCLL